ncbi:MULTISPECIES: gliding motility protein GldL [Polaribacter]|uniref:Gliding motility protein GldL n=1 Tax=Polaribacter sejongensis TaxID=985043 RepID=A0AAJ1QVB1_9FLAO|nr:MULTISPECIES: gliding motility protein GldL [Polaribacter]AUC22062.1 gliding motility protein GldL [Polaribacter sejongensis]MDN3618722.1 gliding motility protein GldL [Polaribacter undariae]UWD33805.1 gliding motility protein GldL [Polaribacter undariae]
MAQSKSYKKIMNFVYGMGAAVVIVGALFKIQHMSLGPITGGMMLTIGLLVEAAVFAVSAFDTPEDDFDWSKVYPELGDDGFTTVKAVKEEKEEVGAQGLLSQKLDTLLQEAKIDARLMTSLGTSMKNFQGAAEGLSAASESISSTNKYNEQMSMAAIQMESLNNLYKVQVENVSKQSALNGAVVENTEKLKDQMESLAKNLSSLNGVYGNMLSAMSK